MDNTGQHPVTLSMEWYLANVTASVDEVAQCVTCNAYVDMLGRNANTCPVCSANGMPSYGVLDQDGWEYLIDRKYAECDWYDFDNGIERPICIVYANGGFYQGNGNHRIAYAIRHDLETIPAVFSFDPQDYMVSTVTDY